jgi:hypothetical protein
MLLLYEREATKADHAAAGFILVDIEETVRELRQKGVKLEDYDVPGIKTVNGIADLGAQRAGWFTDTEGNTLAVAQSVS